MTGARNLELRAATWLIISAATVAALIFGVQGAAAGQSFTFLSAGFTQEIVGAGPGFYGGVAFAPDGDPWVDFCRFSGSSLRRFDLQSTPPDVNGTKIHSFADVVSNAGCGLTNHRDGFLYSNIDDGGSGVSRLNAETGAPVTTMGPPGNALGITVDPQTDRLVYVARDCRSTGTCTIVSLNPTDGTSTTFAIVPGTTASFIDGIAFDPTGNFLFAANRRPGFHLLVLARDGSVVQNIPMSSEPDGISFHATTPKFVVTTNLNGTMTRFDFPGDDYAQTPSQSTFASGGFRGDLTQVGQDGCIYLTQDGTRYDDGTITSENSLVRVCPGFAPPIKPADIDYVALGDSYSSGEGTFNYDNSKPAEQCKRGPDAWPRVLQKRAVNIPTIKHIACAGAKVLDLFSDYKSNPPQIDLRARDPNIELVTLTIGGNDIGMMGFGGIIWQCYQTFSSCANVPDSPSFKQRLQNLKLALKVDVYASLEITYPNALIVHVGYPRITPKPGITPTNCGWLSPPEQVAADRIVQMLDKTIADAVDEYNVPRIQFASVLNALDGHELCTPDSWMVPVNPPFQESGGHPNVQGQKAYAKAVASDLGIFLLPEF